MSAVIVLFAAHAVFVEIPRMNSRKEAEAARKLRSLR